jgi:trimethylamine--corrinoid protein Co-methyltransferase
LVERIIAEARTILCELGVEIHNPGVLSLLADHGAKVESKTKRAHFTADILDKALGTAPSGFALYDVLGNRTHDLSGYNVHFTPGSAAINVLDNQTQSIRPPTTRDYVSYVKVVSQLDNVASQSTAIVPSDVHEKISDSRFDVRYEAGCDGRLHNRSVRRDARSAVGGQGIEGEPRSQTADCFLVLPDGTAQVE